jgi:hypothetical protein
MVSAPDDTPRTITLPSTCHTHSSPKNFCTLRITTTSEGIKLTPHTNPACAMELDANAAAALRDALTKWLP